MCKKGMIEKKSPPPDAQKEGAVNSTATGGWSWVGGERVLFFGAGGPASETVPEAGRERRDWRESLLHLQGDLCRCELGRRATMRKRKRTLKRKQNMAFPKRRAGAGSIGLS